MKAMSAEKRIKVQGFKNRFVAKELGVPLEVYTNAKIKANNEAIRKFNLDD